MKNIALKLAAALALALTLAFIACGGSKKNPDPGPVPVPVAGVSLNRDALPLVFPGPTGSLTATVLPAGATNKAVTWASSNTGVVSVAGSGTNGLTATVTPLSIGTTKITVTTRDGSKTAECNVTVTAATVPVDGVTLGSTTSLALTFPGPNASLTATVTPANATNKSVTWTVAPAGVVSVVGSGANNLTATVTPLAAGTATITVASVADPSKKANCNVVVAQGAQPGGGRVYIAGGFGLFKNGQRDTTIESQHRVRRVVVDSSGVVHACGQYRDYGSLTANGWSAAYWKDGALTILPPGHPSGIYEMITEDIWVSGGHVYIVGWERGTNYTRVARLWIDGQLSELQGIADEPFVYSYAWAVREHDGHVYVVGNYEPTVTDSFRAVIWKDGVKHDFTNIFSFNGIAFDSNGDLYVIEDALWKLSADLSSATLVQEIDGELGCLFIDGTDVYTAGVLVEGDNEYSIHYWKNGVQYDLEIPEITYQMGPTDLFVTGGHVYTAGYWRPFPLFKPLLWIDGKITKDPADGAVPDYIESDKWEVTVFVEPPSIALAD